MQVKFVFTEKENSYLSFQFGIGEIHNKDIVKISQKNNFNNKTKYVV